MSNGLVPKGYRCPGCGKAIKDRDIDSDGMHTCKCGEVIFLPTDALSEVPRETSSVASRRFSPVMGIYGAVLVVVLLLSILNCSAINKTQRDFDNQLSSLESSMMASFESEVNKAEEELSEVREEIEERNVEIEKNLTATASRLVDQIVSKSSQLMTRIDSVQDDLDVLFGRASEKETSDRAKFADLSVEVTKLKAQMKDMATAIVAVNDYVDGLARNDIQRLSASINAVIGKYEALQNATARLADKHYSLVNKHNDAVEVINRNAKRIDNIYNSIRQLSDYAEENRRLLSNHAKVINSLSADIRSLERRVRSLELNP